MPGATQTTTTVNITYRVGSRHEAPGCFPVLAVHDEVVVESPYNRTTAAHAWLTRAMQQGMESILTEVPVGVEAGVYEDWGVTEWEVVI